MKLIELILEYLVQYNKNNIVGTIQKGIWFSINFNWTTAYQNQNDVEDKVYHIKWTTMAVFIL